MLNILTECIFAFGDRLNRIFISRDRFAVKTLYYYLGKGGIYFGSEVKFIRSLINEALILIMNIYLDI